MKTAYILGFLFLFSTSIYLQKTAKADTINPAKGNVKKQLENINARNIKEHSDSAGNQSKKRPLFDSKTENRYGDLLKDDSLYNPRYPFWKPAIEVVGALALTWSIDRFVLKADYSHIGPATWKYNIKTGWEWDNDRFGINFLGHPYSGTLSFNAARSDGYTFYQSAIFSLGCL